MQIIKIVNTQEGRIYFETGGHYKSIRFNSLAQDGFSVDWELAVFGHTFQKNEIHTVMSLNQLRELRDALNKFLPEN